MIAIAAAALHQKKSSLFCSCPDGVTHKTKSCYAPYFSQVFTSQSFLILLEHNIGQKLPKMSSIFHLQEKCPVQQLFWGLPATPNSLQILQPNEIFCRFLTPMRCFLSTLTRFSKLLFVLNMMPSGLITYSIFFATLSHKLPILGENLGGLLWPWILKLQSCLSHTLASWILGQRISL